MRKATVCIALATAVLLLVPLIAMQFTDEVVWGLGDFVIAGAMLIGAGLVYQLLARRGHRAAIGAAIGAVLVLVWAQLAVGLL